MEKVVILMSTYNGEKYLEQQVASLLTQKEVVIRIFVRDDGSSDNTTHLLDIYQDQNILSWYGGENMRSARSFLDLIEKAPPSKYYAFCDQDDVWESDKLKRAVSAIKDKEKESAPGTPILYCSNYQLVDSNLQEMEDNHHVTTTTFNAALVSSCCTGCTVVFNDALRKRIAGKQPGAIVMHDDWLHKVCLSVGGKVIFDNVKPILYRQHGNNVDGGSHSLSHKIKGIVNRMRNKECIRSRQLEELYRLYKDEMPKENAILLKSFIDRYHKGFLGRISIVFDPELKTPYKNLNHGYKLSILLNYF